MNIDVCKRCLRGVDRVLFLSDSTGRANLVFVNEERRKSLVAVDKSEKLAFGKVACAIMSIPKLRTKEILIATGIDICCDCVSMEVFEQNIYEYVRGLSVCKDCDYYAEQLIHDLNSAQMESQS